MNPVRRLRINHKLLALIFILSLLSTAAYTVRSYRVERGTMLQGIDEKLMVAAYSVDQYLGKGYHEKIRDARSVSEAEYERHLRALTEAAGRFKVKYIYSMMKFGDKVYFTSSNATPEELQKKSWDRFFKPYPDASERLKTSFESKQTFFENYGDSYGLDRSVYIPLTAPSGKAYIVAADIPIAFIDARLKQTLLQSLLIGCGIFFLVFVCGYLVVNMISRPLENLAGFTRELVAYDFNPPDEVELGLTRISDAYGDEVGHLAGSFIVMENELRNYIQKVKDTTAAKERMESELRLAREIQMSVLPQEFPPFPWRKEFEIHAHIDPAKEMSGDYYDFYMIDDLLFITIGDVSGKGVPASMFMVTCRTLLEAAANEQADPCYILNKTNLELARKNESMLFVTVFYAILDVRTGEIRYANAGHNPPYVLRADGRMEPVGQTNEPALGIRDDYRYKLGTLQLGTGDAFFMYTDGIPEAMNDDRKQFTPERMEAALRETRASSVTRMILDVVAQVKGFVGEAPQSDDITALAVRYLSQVPQEPAPAGVPEGESAVTA